MGTPFSIPIERFFHRIEEDREFFSYYQLPDDEAMQLAGMRARAYLQNAADKIMMGGVSDVDFSDVDDVLGQFNADLTSREIYLLSSLMYEFYLEKDISKLKTISVNYTSPNLKVFDPSNARTSFHTLYKDVCEQNAILMDDYRNIDRVTGAFKGIDYASYDEGGT